MKAPMAKQSPNYHLSDLEKSVEWLNGNLVTVLSLNCHLTNFYPNLMNGNLATILLPNYHLSVQTRTQTQMEPEVFQKHNIFTARNEVAARYCFHTYVSFCSGGECLCPSMHYMSHDQGSLCPGGLCPGGSVSRESLSGGSLSRGGGLCPGSVCPGGLCPGGRSLSRECLSGGSLSGGRSLFRGSLSGGSLLGRPPRTLMSGRYASY